MYNEIEATRMGRGRCPYGYQCSYNYPYYRRPYRRNPYYVRYPYYARSPYYERPYDYGRYPYYRPYRGRGRLYGMEEDNFDSDIFSPSYKLCNFLNH